VDSVVGNSKNLKILGLEVKKIVEPSNVFTLPYLEFFNFGKCENQQMCSHLGQQHRLHYILNAGKLAPRVANTAHEWFWHKIKFIILFF